MDLLRGRADQRGFVSNHRDTHSLFHLDCHDDPHCQHCQIPSDSLSPQLRYAKMVASGYREPIPDKWPDGIKSLVQQCWSEVGGNRGDSGP